MKFKKGDKVVCIKGLVGLKLIEGKIYTVRSIFSKRYIKIKGSHYEFCPERFREATEMDKALEGL